jgi:hypothetical protein
VVRWREIGYLNSREKCPVLIKLWTVSTYSGLCSFAQHDLHLSLPYLNQVTRSTLPMEAVVCLSAHPHSPFPGRGIRSVAYCAFGYYSQLVVSRNAREFVAAFRPLVLMVMRCVRSQDAVLDNVGEGLCSL